MNNNNKSNIDKILNTLDKIDKMPSNSKTKQINIGDNFKPSTSQVFKPQKPIVEPKPQPQPQIQIKSQPQVIVKQQEPTIISKPIVKETISKDIDLDEIEKRANIHFGSTTTKQDNSSGIKIKQNVGSVLEEINRRTFVQTMSKDKQQFSKTFNIKVIGIGGAGNNIVKYMKTAQDWPDFVQIIALNTDYVALSSMGDLTDIFILGAKELDGNGSGGNPEIGKMAAEADAEIIKDMLKGTDILILTAGLGKGTGTGATPVIAKIAQELGILTIGLFNLPSIGIEGNRTYANALSGLQKLSYLCNGLTTVNNDKIIGLDKERTSIKKAFQGANKYIKTIFEEIINIIVKPSDINVDFADVKNFFEDKNGFLFLRIDLTDYTKDAIKESFENAIKAGFTDMNIKQSPKALLNFKLNENVPSVILENTRSALKEIVGANNVNIVHGVSFNDIYENAEINMLLTGTFDLGAIDDEYDDSLSKLPSTLEEETPTTVSEPPKEFSAVKDIDEIEDEDDEFDNIYRTKKERNDYFDKFINNNRLFDDDDDEEMDLMRYASSKPTSNMSAQVNRTSPTTRISNVDIERKQKKSTPWWKKIINSFKNDDDNDEY